VRRSDDELRELSGHVLWHVRQFCRLGGHLRDRHAASAQVLDDALSAAALEAYLIHARALHDFLWRTRDVPKGTRGPYKDDGLAEDYFAPDPSPLLPPSDADIGDKMRRVGWGVAHVSYRRLHPGDAWGWDFGAIGTTLYVGLIDFARRVPPAVVVPGFSFTLRSEFVERFRIDGHRAMIQLGMLGHSVGTPILRDWLPDA
jgi:hypothetical protein